MIIIIESEVAKLLKDNNDGHGFDHIQRVRNLALQFIANKKVDKNIIEIACLLHDVDDYKLFGKESANGLLNANRIMKLANIDNDTKNKVLEIIKTIGFSKRLEGVMPTTLEGMIVSDADMCDAIGANGILRTHKYSISKGNDFFSPKITPKDFSKLTVDYKNNKNEHSVQHFFDKLLNINSLLITESGRIEGQKRQKIMIDFLRELFIEENSNNWLDYLNSFIEVKSYS